MFARILLLSLICFLSAGTGQAQRKVEDRKFVIAPKESFLLTVVAQPDCPIQIENAKLLFFIGPGSSWGASYRLRNSGTKPLRIQSITLSMWTATGVGSTWQELPQEEYNFISPSQVIKTKEDPRKIEIIPLTDEIRDRLKLRGPLKAIVVLMIEQIKFLDGSVYSAESVSKDLQSYFSTIELQNWP